MRVLRRVMCIVSMGMLLAGVAAAQEAPATDAAPAMSAEEQAMMEAWMKAGTPGEEHALLAGMAGDWDLDVKSWSAPEAPPVTSGGSASMAMMMGGRYLEEHIDGSMMEMPFKGLGYMGYDNVLGKYVSVWMDSMSTGIMRAEGTYDRGTRTFDMLGDYADPVSGKVKTMHSSTRLEGNDRMVFTYYDTAPDGSEFTSMEITYTRK